MSKSSSSSRYSQYIDSFFSDEFMKKYFHNILKN